MPRLKNLYTYLVQNRPMFIEPWVNEYTSFTEDVGKVRTALKGGSSIRDKETYSGTSFASEADPFKALARRLIYQRLNGISSRGQSTLSEEDFEKFIDDTNFVKALETLIREPENASHFDNFRQIWLTMGKGNRPLLINRVLAACTTAVSTTCDEGKFGSVFWWLIDEKLILRPDSDLPDWRSQNIWLMTQLTTSFQDEIQTGQVNVHQLSVFVWELYVNISNPFSLKKQVVRYGAPGTGKTYTARQNAGLLFDMWKAEFDVQGARMAADHIVKVQFHPSYCYEDFMEGLRPILSGGQSQLRLQNGTFKGLCKRAAQWEIDVFQKISPDVAKDWATLTIGDLAPEREKLSGPAWQAVFHNDAKKKVADAVPPFFLIIDEINRAELSRVFGELMYSLEYRGIDGAIQTQYGCLNDEETGMIKIGDEFRFFVPHNLYVIGTMNTIDRSVESFDFALRRRFRWEEVMPDYGVLKYHLEQTRRGKWEALTENLRKLNEAISQQPLLGSDYQIGHAYLMNLTYPLELSVSQARTKIWEDSVKPLIEEYLRGTGKTTELLEEFAQSFGIS